tara:strand:- start:25464 stop:26150 length:687 start_codon:yes stop_codon:yes gene_type:complete
LILIDNPKDGDVIDMLETMYPTIMMCKENDFASDCVDHTTYGFVTEGGFSIKKDNDTYMVSEGSFFSLAGKYECKSLVDGSKLFAIIRKGFRGLDQVGKTEDRGRLSYIDGCTDTLLVMPPRLGDPCLNYLHFPVGIDQTQHLHPSIRMGIVIDGKGEAFQKPDGKQQGWEKDLKKGMMFCLEEGEVHSFRTAENFMDIIAYHPDSDFGPTDTNHPMLNRTYIDHGKG